MRIASQSTPRLASAEGHTATAALYVQQSGLDDVGFAATSQEMLSRYKQHRVLLETVFWIVHVGEIRLYAVLVFLHRPVSKLLNSCVARWSHVEMIAARPRLRRPQQ